MYTGPVRRFLPFLIVGCLWCIPALSAAASVSVSLAPEELNLGQRMAASAAHAVVRLSGRGDAIAMRYSSPAPIDCVVLITDGKAVPDLSTALVATLPLGKDLTIDLNVSASPGWSLGTHEYRVFFFSHASDGTTMERVTLVPASFWRLPVAALRHLFTSEPYLPASYHRLKGYRILGVAAPLVLLPVVILLLILTLALRRFRGRRLAACLMILALGFLLPSARFSLDLLAFAGRHLTMWYGDAPYEQAGSAYAIAEFLQSANYERATPAVSPIYLCSEGTSYIPSLLTYLLSPTRVVQKLPEGQTPVMLIAFQQPQTAKEGQAFQCGDRVFNNVKPLRSFADGSVVYSVPQP
ncbi:MAG: hypothetical protein WC353_05415 [Candidatus Peribacter sp.]|jgi:hypothetical protein